MFRSKLNNKRNKRHRRTSRFERLESRQLLAARILDVEVTADEIDSSDGFSLREAMIAAHAFPDADEVTINLQAGETYKLRKGGEFGDFEILRSMTINGNGAVIDGDLATRLFEVHQQPGGVDVVFQDITLREGKQAGGAVRIENVGGSVTFVDSTLEDNLVQGNSNADGGAIYVVGGSLIIDGSTLQNNRAEGLRGETDIDDGGAGARARGAAIYANDVDIIIRNGSVLQGNTAVGGDGGTGSESGGDAGSALGGAIYAANSSNLRVLESEVIGNTALGGRGGNARDDDADAGRGGLAEGGAIFLNAGVSSVGIVDSVFRDNIARGRRGGHSTNSDGENRGEAGDGGDARGGAIRTQANAVTIIDTEFTGNEALAGTGGDSDRGISGHGGIARGGAIDIRPGTNMVDIQGTITSGNSEDSLVAGTTYTTLFSSNIARGGAGGSKADTDESGGDAGNGGISYGGAIHQDSGVSTIDGVVMIGNIADGGFGGHGANSATGCGDDVCIGTAGGDNGRAEGGAIKTDVSLTLRNSSFIGNLAAGGLPVEGSRVAAGLGGFNSDGRGQRGGKGGDAHGGALRVFEADLVVTDTGFTGNTAFGGMGGGGGVGFGLDEDDAHGGDGGRGGDAGGGAISATLTDAHEAQLERLIVTSNSTVAGAGGIGGDGAQGGDVDNESNGGRGGFGGDAFGGGISLNNRSDSNSTQVTISDAIVSGNTLISGDGGGGGRGGIGEADQHTRCEDGKDIFGNCQGDEIISFSYPGGDGGNGGNGGLAYGGGIFLRSAESLIEGSTIDSNVVSGGFGGRGGAGGSGDIHRTDFEQYDRRRLGTRGGDGGDGGDARVASGGGIALQGGSTDIRRSTIVSNIVVSGSGGVGGDGAPGREYGGDGGDGGNGGNANGGGIRHLNGGSTTISLAPLLVTASTVARNTVNAGSAGFGGARGDNIIIINLGSPQEEERINQPLRSLNGRRFPLTSTTVLVGASAGLDPAFANPNPQSQELLAAEQTPGDGTQSDLISDAAVAASIGAVTVGAGAGTAAVTGLVLGGATLASGFLIAGAGSFVLTLGVGVGFAALPVAAAVGLAVKFSIAVASGDSFHDALESTVSVDPSLLGSGVSFGALFFAGGNNKVYEPLTPRDAGDAGSRGSARHAPWARNRRGRLG